MKKILGILFTVWIMFQAGTAGAQAPDYEKYGKIAIMVVQADYPGEEVTEYQYLGRNKLEKRQVEDSFLFTVNENGKKVDVTVRVRHSLTNNKMLNLTVEEIRG
ncbi:DUF3889 domain-containing protein [Peribacillus cavernae]|uniref:DUF3889 domain-containing protein n=1 Tax=Peribacillus cavernae TaxID=1674310 RepID=A0A433HE97_9BACI|nr:DUF3889 domain-containing protein [Peribacillus cavernae]MDQ0219908.1 uncharacterized protein YxeA [Peribacillus cavernae]RUQ26609.1 DUF3889 domain-containing protein [Peribacillus cavernae]